MANTTYIKIFVDYLDALELLDDAEKGRLFTALLEYARSGEVPQLIGNERFMFPVMKVQIDRDNETSKQNAANGTKGGRGNKSPDSETKPMKAAESEEKQTEVPEINQKAALDNQKAAVYSQKAAVFDVNDKECVHLHHFEEKEEKSAPLSSPLFFPPDPLLSPPYNPPAEKKKESHARGAFDVFWAAYPKKVGKIAARKAFEKVHVPVDELLAAVERQKNGRQWKRDNGQYIPNPTTWLNQGRWDDEVAEKKSGFVYDYGSLEDSL